MGGRGALPLMTDPVWGVDMFSLLTGDDGPRYHWAIRMAMLLLGAPLGRSTVIRGVCELGMAIGKEVRSYEGGLVEAGRHFLGFNGRSYFTG